MSKSRIDWHIRISLTETKQWWLKETEKVKSAWKYECKSLIDRKKTQIPTNTNEMHSAQ